MKISIKQCKTKLSAVLFVLFLLQTLSNCASAQPVDQDYEQRGRLLETYFASKDAFAANDLSALKANIANFQAEAKVLRLRGLQFEDMARLKKVRDSIGQEAAVLQNATSMEEAKAIISTLGTQMWSMIEKMKFADEPLYLQYCPMEEAYWISDEKQIFNPFSPKIMPKCGTVVKGLTDEDYKVEDCCH